MVNSIVSKIVSLGLAGVVTLSILGSINALTPMPMEGSMLASILAVTTSAKA